MVQNAAEGEDVRSVNAEQGCSQTELLIVGNSNKVVYLTSRVTGLISTISFVTFLIAPLWTKLTLLYKYTPNSRNFSKELNSIVARFLNSNVT